MFSDACAGAQSYAITETGQGINTTHGEDVPAAFERSVRVAVQSRTLRSQFTDVPELNIDTAAYPSHLGLPRVMPC